MIGRLTVPCLVQISRFLELSDTLPLLLASKDLYGNQTLWRDVLRAYSETRTLACSASTQISDLSWSEIRRIAQRSARLHKSLTQRPSQGRVRRTIRNERFLEFISGTDLVVTYSIGEYSTVIRCRDLANPECPELAQMTCPQTTTWRYHHRFDPQRDDGGQYILTLLILPPASTEPHIKRRPPPPLPGPTLLILRLNYSDRSNVIFDVVANLPFPDHELGPPGMRAVRVTNLTFDIRSTTEAVTIVGFERNGSRSVFYTAYGKIQIPIESGLEEKEVELKIWRRRYERKSPWISETYLLHNSFLYLFLCQDVRGDYRTRSWSYLLFDTTVDGSDEDPQYASQVVPTVLGPPRPVSTGLILDIFTVPAGDIYALFEQRLRDRITYHVYALTFLPTSSEPDAQRGPPLELHSLLSSTIAPPPPPYYATTYDHARLVSSNQHEVQIYTLSWGRNQLKVRYFDPHAGELRLNTLDLPPATTGRWYEERKTVYIDVRLGWVALKLGHEDGPLTFISYV